MVPATHSFVPSWLIARPWWAESSRYCSRGVLAASSLIGRFAIRRGRVGLHVELDEAVQERQLHVRDPLAWGDRHRAHGRRVALVTVRGEDLADVQALADRVVARVDDLEPAVALRGVGDRLVGRRVDEPDARVADP